VLDSIKRCHSCGLAQVNPLGYFRGENETEEYFLNDYLPLHLANKENSLAERRAHILAIKDRFSLPAHAQHLDVGCALGSMLQEAKAAGWNSSGVETSEFAAQYAAKHTGCKVFPGTLQEAQLQSAFFDVITLMDVIEHVSDPLPLVSEMYRILAPGGVLFIVTPNFRSLFVRLYGENAYGIWPDQHVVYFEPNTISRLLYMAGFSRVLTASKDFYSPNLNRLLHRKEIQAADIKTAFGRRSVLGKFREFANRILTHLKIGDKLLAFAQK
jgi:2-polyprenyl-3-methyl-5-hydroxy-6-metoxy-1,4-benzoquinol methylase